MNLTETEKVQAATDLADAVYFLHGHSKPIIHGNISLLTALVDGETHRAKLCSKISLDRLNILNQKKIERYRDFIVNVILLQTIKI